MNTLQDNQRQAILAYLAGIMDGEGTIRIAKDERKKRMAMGWCIGYVPAVGIGMSDEKVIKLFRDILIPNGRVWQECVPNRKKIYRCGTSGTEVIIRIIELLLPYLIVKKPQAELVLKFCKEKVVKGFRRNKGLPIKELQRREDLYFKVKKFNACGAAAQN